MFDTIPDLGSAGMQVENLCGDAGFMSRPLRTHRAQREAAGLRRLAHIFVQSPEHILQQLVEVSMELCDAESAGITLEEPVSATESQFRWIATAGRYGPFVGAVLPRYFSPCGTCLERGEPQLFRVPKAYLDSIGVDAPPVTDGILIPWSVNGTQGTIWVLAHESYHHFDREDYRVMRDLSDFAAIAVRHQDQQSQLMRQAAAAAAAKIANSLAHEINNPLQGLIQTVFLAGQDGPEAGVFARQAMGELRKLSDLVKQLLSLQKPDPTQSEDRPRRLL
jgi:hypothetical protein